MKDSKRIRGENGNWTLDDSYDFDDFVEAFDIAIAKD
jgi:hypothetical protein